ncbi:MAG: hypothetical protein U9R19_02090 [Bacteroidota bacterium]|nr:hypothetical protein [Bacteroidota bacterium]
MKFDFRKFFAFGLITSLAFMFITAIIVYISPVVPDQSWLFFGMPKVSWQTQFVFSFYVFALFLILFLIKINMATVKTFLQKEFPEKISGSKELWVAVVLIFVFLSLTGLDITSLQSIARVSHPTLTSIGNNELLFVNDTDISNTGDNTSLAEMKLSVLAGNFTGMTLKKASKKIEQSEYDVPGKDPIIRKIAKANDISINNVINIVGEGEKLMPGKRIGKSISNRTLAECIEEIGISQQEVLTIFSRKNIQHTGNFNKSIKSIADENKLLPIDLYAIINGEEPKLIEPPQQKQLPRQKQKTDELTGFEKIAKSKSIEELAEIIKKQQPDAEVSKDIIIERLKWNDIKLSDDKQTMGEIAHKNNVSIDDLLHIIAFNKQKSKPPMPGAQRMDGPPPHIKEKQKRNQAKQLMQSSVSNLALKYKLSESDLFEALKNNGIEANSGQTVEDIAKANDKRPGEILKVLREERQRQEKKE